MLTRRFMDDDQPQLIRRWGWAGLAVVLLLGGLIYTLRFFPGFETITRTVPAGGENIAEFGMALVDPNGFVIPFEVASILLLAAMIGAIFVAIERKERT
jgi:NADH-quinone oxidoreductase subunit J